MKAYYFLLHMILMCTVLTGCSTPVGLLSSALSQGGQVAIEGRPSFIGLQDRINQFKISRAIEDANLESFKYINIDIYEARLLLTGSLPNQEAHDQLLQIIKKNNYAHEILDELIVIPKQGVLDWANDQLIELKYQSQLIGDMDTRSVNYIVQSEFGHLYVLGVALDQKELDRIKEHVDMIAGIRNATFHVELVNAESRKERLKTLNKQ